MMHGDAEADQHALHTVVGSRSAITAAPESVAPRTRRQPAPKGDKRARTAYHRRAVKTLIKHVSAHIDLPLLANAGHLQLHEGVTLREMDRQRPAQPAVVAPS